MSVDPMAALTQRFLERCAADLADLQALIQTGQTGSPEVRRIVHGLAGAAGTFGFVSLGDAAAAADEVLADGGTLTPVQIAPVLVRLEELVRPASA